MTLSLETSGECAPLKGGLIRDTRDHHTQETEDPTQKRSRGQSPDEVQTDAG